MGRGIKRKPSHNDHQQSHNRTDRKKPRPIGRHCVNDQVAHKSSSRSTTTLFSLHISTPKVHTRESSKVLANPRFKYQGCQKTIYLLSNVCIIQRTPRSKSSNHPQKDISLDPDLRRLYNARPSPKPLPPKTFQRTTNQSRKLPLSGEITHLVSLTISDESRSRPIPVRDRLRWPTTRIHNAMFAPPHLAAVAIDQFRARGGTWEDGCG